MSAAGRRPSNYDVIRTAIEKGMRRIGTVIPAKVVKWDAAKQRADCQILVKNVTRGEEDDREVASWPVVTGVPVQFPGASGFRVTFPISDGTLTINGTTKAATTGSLFFSHRSLDKWLSGTGGEVDPEFDHDHGPNDGIFLPGLMPFGAALSDVPEDEMNLGSDASATVQIHLRADQIIIGDDSGAEFMFLAETLNTDLKDFVTGLYTILQGGTVGGPTAQQINLLAQYLTLQLYTRMVAGGSAYLSTKVKSK